MVPESTLNLIVTGLFTLGGVILGAWLERFFHEKGMRERSFKALFEEIKLNGLVARRNKETCKRPAYAVFDLSPFYTLAYQNIRTSGELAILSRETLSLLEDTYEIIYVHNRQTTAMSKEVSIFTRYASLEEGIEKIEANLAHLEEILPKEVSCLDDCGY